MRPIQFGVGLFVFKGREISMALMQYAVTITAYGHTSTRIFSATSREDAIRKAQATIGYTVKAKVIPIRT